MISKYLPFPAGSTLGRIHYSEVNVLETECCYHYNKRTYTSIKTSNVFIALNILFQHEHLIDKLLKERNAL